ncbi:hypothetical protein EDD11_005216 [Mortierella claussenii]|nr:hypothetical protein EDD11_005216 [Mortierella claussenii]
MACPAGYSFQPDMYNTPYAAVTESLQPGEPFHYWDYDIVWSENHVPASKLEPLRSMSDDLADRAIEVLKIERGEDAYDALLRYTSRPEGEQESDAPRLLLEQLMTVPEWVDWEKIKRGQDVYWRYSILIAISLFYFVLAGGFAIPKISRVLGSTGYLTGSGKKVRRRICETSQFVVDVMHSLAYLQPGTGVAWKSIIQVRLLHAGVRSRLVKISKTHSKIYNVDKLGVPINQEDLLATLFSFSNTPWRVMETRMGVQMTPQEREDYLHLWRYIGHMMGVNDILGGMHSPAKADATLESIVLHLADPDQNSGHACMGLLQAMTPPQSPFMEKVIALGLPDPLKLHMCVSSLLLGSEFWKLSSLPATEPTYKYYQQMIIQGLIGEQWLVDHMPRWWYKMRRFLIRDAYYFVISREIKQKKSPFALQAVPEVTHIGQESGKQVDYDDDTEVAASTFDSMVVFSVAMAVTAVLVVIFLS